MRRSAAGGRPVVDSGSLPANSRRPWGSRRPVVSRTWHVIGGQEQADSSRRRVAGGQWSMSWSAPRSVRAQAFARQWRHRGAQRPLAQAARASPCAVPLDSVQLQLHETSILEALIGCMRWAF